MKFQAKHQGKWVASKNEKVIADSTTLNKLMKKVAKENMKEIVFALVPKGFIAG